MDDYLEYHLDELSRTAFNSEDHGLGSNTDVDALPDGTYTILKASPRSLEFEF